MNIEWKKIYQRIKFQTLLFGYLWRLSRFYVSAGSLFFFIFVVCVFLRFLFLFPFFDCFVYFSIQMAHERYISLIAIEYDIELRQFSLSTQNKLCYN